LAWKRPCLLKICFILLGLSGKVGWSAGKIMC
jgi:hypothetical protein